MAMRDASPVARSAWLTSVMDTGPKPAPLIPWRRFGKAGIAVLAVFVLVGVWLFVALTPSIERGDRTHLFDLAQVENAGDGRVLADPAGGTTTFAVEIRNAMATADAIVSHAVDKVLAQDIKAAAKQAEATDADGPTSEATADAPAVESGSLRPE